jgi:hypothetical protein
MIVHTCTGSGNIPSRLELVIRETYQRWHMLLLIGLGFEDVSTTVA